MAVRWVVVALCLLAGSCAPVAMAPVGPPAAPQASAAPLPERYDAAAIYRLEFHGIRLGMARDEACRTLLANGYHLRFDSAGCGPLAPFEDGEESPRDNFGGSARGSCHPEQCRPGTPAEQVSTIIVLYERIAGRDIVNDISVSTVETEGSDALAADGVRHWGRPTFRADWGYTVLNYAASPREADFYARGDFGQCRTFPECAAEDGIDCGAILNDLSAPHARVLTVYGGRSITIEDPRPYVARLRASGELQGRRLRRSGRICHRVPAH